ncbi:STELLO glycosyltransferase family protein [Sinomonas sp. B1-1]|uniref:STELLO glycosyltransferase family protein n=1 Tax=Sinomonas sp. B1-1 TaxID=3141454 RepID=UPI003D2B7BA4
MIEQAMVLTTINAPTKAVLELSQSSQWPLIVVGDKKTPSDWQCEKVVFISAAEQMNSETNLAKLLPWNHYCRKNLGYLAAMALGTSRIAETDDDNHPKGWPHATPEDTLVAPVLSSHGWANIYEYFTDSVIWPRGLPLTEISGALPKWEDLKTEVRSIGVHQYLAAGDPDVDAIYRLTVGRDDHTFEPRSLILDSGTMVPFNSQCTIWTRAAYPLMYLPSHVSFRMTDIWRSFVAQICLWAMGSHVAYHGEGVYQERNAHDLHRDFLQEVVGYQRNDDIFHALRSLELSPLASDAGANLRRCYEALEKIGIVESRELELVDAWLADISSVIGKVG